MPRFRLKWPLLRIFALLLATFSAGTACAVTPHSADWPLWREFQAGFIQDDGRVVDWTDAARTVSEGQAYAMFFALVANDPEQFSRLLAWTRDNLANGDLDTNLPAWHWGRDPVSGRWGVLDRNSATDADLFIAYTLFEAARLWRRDDYAVTAGHLLAMVVDQAVRERGGRQLLLPAPLGFRTTEADRINPSYLVPFQLRYFAHVDPQGPWMELLEESVAALDDIAPRGLVPDWALVTDEGYRPDPTSGTVGSYDAIRNYMWAAMDVPGLPASRASRRALRGGAEQVRRLGYMPERWDVATAAHRGVGSPGFQLAMATLTDAEGDFATSAKLRIRARNSFMGGLYGTPAHYYDQVLALFAEGWTDKRFRFDALGRMRLLWTTDSDHSR